MSQDKLVACVCGYPSAQGVHHRSNGPCFVEPVAAQEPIAWMHGTDGRFEVIHAEVKKLWERVGQPAQFAKEVVSCKVENYTIPLYSNAAPCARCTEAERIEALATAKLGDEIIKNGTLQDNVDKQEAEIAQLSDHVEDAKEIIQKMMKAEKQQADRIKALEAFVDKLEHANTEVGNESMALRRKLVIAEAKRAKADAVIEVAKAALAMDQLSWYHQSRSALAAIEAYQKGE